MVQVEEVREYVDARRRRSGPSGQSPSRNPRRSRHIESEDDIVLSTNPEHVKNIVLAMLKHKTFVGTYKESRYVDSLHDYRDIIEIEERDPIIHIISELQERLRRAYPQCWLGYTLPKSLPSLNGHCFWVELADKVFEPYYFRITNIKFREREICFVIKTEGKVVPEMTDSQADIYEMINNSKDALRQSSITFLLSTWQLLTLENVKNTFTFLAALICMLGTAGVYCADYLLRFMRECSIMIKALTPFLLSVVNLVQKVIGATFILFATIWRDLFGGPRRYQTPPTNRQYLTY